MVVLHPGHEGQINWPYLYLFPGSASSPSALFRNHRLSEVIYWVSSCSFPDKTLLLVHFLPKNGTIALVAAQLEWRIISGTSDLITVIWGAGGWVWNNILLLSSAEVVSAGDVHEIFATGI